MGLQGEHFLCTTRGGSRKSLSCKIENSPLLRPALRPGPPAGAVNDGFEGFQSDAGSSEEIGFMKAGEGAIDFESQGSGSG